MQKYTVKEFHRDYPYDSDRHTYAMPWKHVLKHHQCTLWKIRSLWKQWCALWKIQSLSLWKPLWKTLWKPPTAAINPPKKVSLIDHPQENKQFVH